MTDLRDARLRRALDEAPDAQLRPLPRTREAVLAAARAQASPLPWWRRLWAPASGASRMPWNAAFATLLVAGFVSVLWQGQEVPDAQPERAAKPAAAPDVKDAAPAEAPAAANTGSVVTGRAAPAAPAAPAPASPPPPAAAAAKAAAPAHDLGQLRDAPAVVAQAAPPQTAPAELAKQPAREDKQAGAREERQAAPKQDFAGSASGSVQATEPPALARSPAAPSVAAAPAPAPAPARSATPTADAAAGAGTRLRAAPSEAAVAVLWTHLQLEGGGKSLLLARGDALALAQDIDSAVRAPTGSAAFAEEPEFRVRLLDGARVVGTLTIGRSQSGWTPGTEPGVARLLAADPARVQSLRSELERRLR